MATTTYAQPSCTGPRPGRISAVPNSGRRMTYPADTWPGSLAPPAVLSPADRGFGGTGWPERRPELPRHRTRPSPGAAATGATRLGEWPARQRSRPGGSGGARPSWGSPPFRGAGWALLPESAEQHGNARVAGSPTGRTIA